MAGRSEAPDQADAIAAGGAKKAGAARVEANARLTSSTAVVLLVLLAAEGATLLSLHRLLTVHVVVGMLLVPPVVVKICSTGYRFARYYLGDPAYRAKGAPPALLRLLGPFVVVLTAVLLASGIALLLAPLRWRADLLFVHKASFVLWFGAMAIHVLGHLFEVLSLGSKDWYGRARRDVRGAGARQSLLAASLAAGLLLAIWIAPHVGSYYWLSR
jgi:hypothetical protein